MKIGIIGLWHLGAVTAACLAEIGRQIVGVDDDHEVVANLKKGIPPLDEPGLKESLAKHKIEFSTDYSALADCQAVFLTHDTPVTDNDEPDTSVLFAVVKKMAPHLTTDALFVVMSQAPVGTTHELAKIAGLSNQAIYFPENLQLGKAMECFLHPERVVIGADNEEARNRFVQIIKPIDCPRLNMGIASAEMSKHALNAFLATSLSFTYNISDLCEKVGADVTDVMAALRADKRIGQAAYLDTSLGFSGGTLMRDLQTLSAVGKKHNLGTPVIDSVISANQNRLTDIVSQLEKKLTKPLSQFKICVLGVTYKPGTSTLRRSRAVELIKLLQTKGARISAYDPGAKGQEFTQETGLVLSADTYQACHDCQIAILVTNWPALSELDFVRLKQAMQEPFVFFDTRNIYKTKEKEINQAGFRYQGIGR